MFNILKEIKAKLFDKSSVSDKISNRGIKVVLSTDFVNRKTRIQLDRMLDDLSKH